MPKYIEIQSRKLISSYGGVGSIIETIHGALIIEPFDKWRYFVEIQAGRITPVEIEDDRLLSRLQFIFPNLKKLIKVPSNLPQKYNSSVPMYEEQIINAKYFPEWMYCNRCGRLRHIKDWWEGWKNVYHGSDKRDKFIPPKCYVCYKEASEQKRRRQYYELEQVRFIMTAPDGSIRDIPWERWPNAIKNSEDNTSKSGSIVLNFDELCCENQDLRYKKSSKFYDLAGISIICENCGKRNTLAGLFNLKLRKKTIDKEGNKKTINFKPVIRTSNSIYYPIIINSLFLPQKDVLPPELKTTIKTLDRAGMSIDQIYNTLKDKYKVSLDAIKNFLQPNEFISETEYRLKEYNYLVSTENIEDNNLLYINEDTSSLKALGISKLIKVKKLKLTSVQTGYTRQEPLDKDLFSQQGDDLIQIDKERFIKAKFTSTKGPLTEYLPAIENFGEGIFVDFDGESLENWCDNSIKNNKFADRINKLIENALNTEIILSKEKKYLISDPKMLAKFILIHTLSHILIKEFEFLVGYHSASLTERLYFKDGEMHGLLIYTIAGLEGSYGGLVTQSAPERFLKILKSALMRAKDCSSDLICYNSDGQGFGGLNLAACYSCALLPETSCEELNGFLDRAILIDEEFGFFKAV